MPIHDWTRVEAGVFHHFHVEWIGDLARVLNKGLLPEGYYSLAEQITGVEGGDSPNGDREPDVLTLKGPIRNAPPADQFPGSVALLDRPPKVRIHQRLERDRYADKAKSIVIRHTSGHEVIAVMEIVSPGNKASKRELRSFVAKAHQFFRSRIHLMVVDLFPPSARDPRGIHGAIWEDFERDNDRFELSPDKPLTLASYLADPVPEAFVEPVSVGDALPDMPLFLTPGIYIQLPLEATYRSAWEAVPAFWREVLEAK
jgi:hypothetical protein